MGKKKKYIPNRKHNPIVIANKIETLTYKLDALDKTINALSKSHDNHISYLGNFARHDIKNAILSMDSILTVTTPEEFNTECIETLSLYLGAIKDTLDNFIKLVPFSSNGTFKIPDLMIAVGLLTRSDMQRHDIDLDIQFERDSNIEIELPFQSILQMINNLVINSIKALESTTIKKIRIESLFSADTLNLFISDNGNVISENDKYEIFNYGYSTTGGSGIGLYHAKYLCDAFKGNIELLNEAHEGMNKTFCITLKI